MTPLFIPGILFCGLNLPLMPEIILKLNNIRAINKYLKDPQ